MGVLSVEQVRVFLAIIDCGSFSAAARALRRHQSAISYAVTNLETQLGIALFDRSGQKPQLTAAGAALLPDARKLAYSLDALRDRAQAFARGIEAELSIAVDAFTPLDFLARAMADFQRHYPMIKPALHLKLARDALNLVLDGHCALGILPHPLTTHENIEQFPLRTGTRISCYASIHHPLAALAAPLENHDLTNHVQLVLAEAGNLSLGQELAMFSPRTWASNDMRLHLALLLQGVGWGFMPEDLVAVHVAGGELVQLKLAVWPEQGSAAVTLMVIRHQDAALGPAANWLLKRLIGDSPDTRQRQAADPKPRCNP